MRTLLPGSAREVPRRGIEAQVPVEAELWIDADLGSRNAEASGSGSRQTRMLGQPSFVDLRAMALFKNLKP